MAKYTGGGRVTVYTPLSSPIATSFAMSLLRWIHVLIALPAPHMAMITLTGFPGVASSSREREGGSSSK